MKGREGGREKGREGEREGERERRREREREGERESGSLPHIMQPHWVTHPTRAVPVDEPVMIQNADLALLLRSKTVPR